MCSRLRIRSSSRRASALVHDLDLAVAGREYVWLGGFEEAAVKNRVEELREARGWTNVELGDKLNVWRQTIHAIESERYDPSLPLALAIARLFGEPVERMFGEDAVRPLQKSTPVKRNIA